MADQGEGPGGPAPTLLLAQTEGPSEEKSRPMYSKNMKELANDFNEFFASVGRARAADESKRPALVNNLPPESPL